MMDGHAFEVAYVNVSRAHCIAKEPHAVTVRGKNGPRTFVAMRKITLDISPNAGVDVLAEVQK